MSSLLTFSSDQLSISRMNCGCMITLIANCFSLHNQAKWGQVNLKCKRITSLFSRHRIQSVCQPTYNGFKALLKLYLLSYTAKWIWDRSIYSMISIDMTLFQYFWRFTQIGKKFAEFARKIVLLLFLNNFTTEKITKTILQANAASFFQICVNLQKYWNNVMPIDGLIIEYMDLSHINLAVISWDKSFSKTSSIKLTLMLHTLIFMNQYWTGIWS